MAGKRKAGRKGGARKRRGKARPMSIGAYLGRIKAMHDAAVFTVGACYIADPKTGQQLCIRTSPEACKALKGTYVGGPCG